LPEGVASRAGRFFGGAGWAGTTSAGNDGATATGAATDAVEPDVPLATGPLADRAGSEGEEEGCFSWPGTAEAGV